MTFDFIRLLKVIEEMQLDVFSTSEIAQLVNFSPADIQNYLETLANNELITRIEKGKYCRIYIKDKYILGSKIIDGGVISHQSALALHNVDLDIPGEVYVSSCHQKTNKVLSGTRINFIRIRPHKDFGSMKINRFNLDIRVTDIEKTILDCLDLPRYVRSYKKFLNCVTSLHLDQQKLLEYGFRMQNFSLLKRLAYLFDSDNPIKYSEFLHNIEPKLNQRYTLLDPAGPDCGPFNSKWRIRNNLN